MKTQRSKTYMKIIIAGFFSIIIFTMTLDMIFRFNLFNSAVKVHDRQFNTRPTLPDIDSTGFSIGDLSKQLPSKALQEKYGKKRKLHAVSDEQGFFKTQGVDLANCNIIVVGDSFANGDTPENSIAGLLTSTKKFKAFHMGFYGYPVNSVLSFMDVVKPLKTPPDTKKHLVMIISKQNLREENLADILVRTKASDSRSSKIKSRLRYRTLLPENLFKNIQQHSLIKRADRVILEQITKHVFFYKNKIFNSSPQENVILGKNGFLFYPSEVEFFQSSPSEESINMISDILSFVKIEAAARGFDLMVVLAPNKSDIYSRYLPEDKIPIHNDTALLFFSQVQNALDNKNIDCINMMPILVEKASNSDILLFHKDDSHWNSKGRLITVSEILGNINKDITH